MNKLVLLIISAFTIVGFGFLLIKENTKVVVNNAIDNQAQDRGGPGEQEPHFLSIEYLRKGEYPGSEVAIEQTLKPGSNYQRYIVS